MSNRMSKQSKPSFPAHLGRGFLMKISESGVDFAKVFREEIASREWNLERIPEEMYQTHFSIKEWFMF